MFEKLEFLSSDADPLTEDEIAHVAATIGPIPDDYRNFLLESNGGRLRSDDGLMVPVNTSTLPDYSEDVVCVTTFAVIDPQFPPMIVPGIIGGRKIRMIEVAGLYQLPIFLMSLALENYGSIYCWFHSNEALWDAEDRGAPYQPTDSNSCFIASSFKEFVDIAIPQNTTKKKADLDVKTMEKSVENYARYGDQCLADATAFFDKLSVKELNAGWPKGAKHPFQPIRIAAGWKQISVVQYLISRGVDVAEVSRFPSSLEVSKLVVEAGDNTLKVKQDLLLAAAGKIISTTEPEHPESIISWLTKSDVQPDFNNFDEHAKWSRCIRYCSSK